MVDIFSHFPEYCEFATNFWLLEPLNVITNFGFIIGAYFLYRFIKINKPQKGIGVFLISTMLILGFGSLSWHSYRSLPTLLLDEIPIYIFIIFVSYFLTQSLTRSHKLTTVILFFTATVYYAVFAYIPGMNLLSGLLKYVFALLAFLILSILVIRKFGPDYNFSLPLVIFSIAIIFRGIDLYVCPIFPIGTHFIWHILVALTMYLGSAIIVHLSLSK